MDRLRRNSWNNAFAIITEIVLSPFLELTSQPAVKIAAVTCSEAFPAHSWNWTRRDMGRGSGNGTRGWTRWHVLLASGTDEDTQYRTPTNLPLRTNTLLPSL